MSWLDQARSFWSPLPDWVEALAEEADRSNQAKAARRISYSSSVVSTILKNAYSGDLKAVEQAVRDGLMRGTVDCPVKGEISGTECRSHQLAPFAATSSRRVQLYRACRSGCPHSRLGEES
jgi:hypothetical protein